MFNRKFFYILSSFVAGFSIMTVELISSRIVAPIIGSSVFTWTSVIGITLLGMSVGSFIGGKIADKITSNKSLPIVFLSSAFFIVLIPILAENTNFITASYGSILKINLLLSTYLFILPAVILGMIQPMILKKYADDFSKLGSEYGTLSAAWSVGSVLGVFLTGFYFVSNIGSRETIWLISLLLFLIGIIFALADRKVIMIFILMLFISPVFFKKDEIKIKEDSVVVFQKETDYYNARIVDTELPEFGESRILFLDFDSHSIETKTVNHSFYPEMYPVFSSLKSNIEEILVIGAGAYTMPKHFKDYYKNAGVSVIETDPEMINIGNDFFDLKHYEIQTIVGDARMVLNNDKKTYDLIFGDAYNSYISVPWYLLTREWNDKARERLNANGMYAVNFIGSINGVGAEFTKTVANTFKSSFPNFYAFSFGSNAEQVQNIVLVGIKGDLPMTEKELYEKLIQGKYGFMASNLFPGEYLIDEQSTILTDNFSPVEKLMEPIIKDHFPKTLYFVKNFF